MKNKFIVLVAIITLLSGCVNFEKLMSSKLNRHIDSVTAEWGAPDAVMPNRSTGGATYTWTTVRSNKYRVWQCRQTLVTNSSDYVTKWSYSGC